MRIDLDQRLTFAFICGWGVVIGSGIANLIGKHVDPAVVGAAGTAIVTSLGAGFLRGSASEPPEPKEGGPDSEANQEA